MSLVWLADAVQVWLSPWYASAWGLAGRLMGDRVRLILRAEDAAEQMQGDRDQMRGDR